MNTSTPEQVKNAVYQDLQSKRLTQQAIGDKLGILRQTVAAILSSKDEYFSYKNATLFSLAFGYDRDYLLNGSGTLFPISPSGVISDNLDHLIKAYTIQRDAISALGEVNVLVNHIGNEKCRDILDKAYILYNCVNTMEYARKATNSLQAYVDSEGVFYYYFNDLEKELTNKYHEK